MPTLRQLQALSLIAQTASFTRTAERLFITQSAVSALIRELESEVGHQLIVRGRSLRLTPVGEHIERAGRHAHDEVERALAEVRGDRKWTEALLRVAVGSLSAATFVPRALSLLAREHEGARVMLIDRPVAMVQDLLLSGEADVALGASPGPRIATELSAELLLRDSLCVVGSRKGPYIPSVQAGRSGLTWGALEGADLILIGPVGGRWNALVREKIARLPRVKATHEVQLFSTGMALVQEGLGVAVLPRFAARALDPKAFWVEDLHSPNTWWTLHWMTRRNSHLASPAYGALHAAITQALRALTVQRQAPSRQPAPHRSARR